MLIIGQKNYLIAAKLEIVCLLAVYWNQILIFSSTFIGLKQAKSTL
jgi:hypothetical protein